MTDIKKLLQIMSETTTSGSVAPLAGAVGNSMLKRPTDTIFAAENIDPEADTGLEESPKVDTPANFGLWKNSAAIGKEQTRKKGQGKMKVDLKSKEMYPQLKENYGRAGSRMSRDSYQRDYDSSTSGFGGRRNPAEDESNLLYIYKDGKLKQMMIPNSHEREARAQGFRDSQEEALKLHGIIRSKFDPKRFVQNIGGKWTQVFPYGQQKTVDEGAGEGDFEKALNTLSGSWSGWHEVGSSNPDVKVYDWDDGEGGYYGSGSIEHNLKTGEITVDYSGEYGDEVKGTFKNMGDAMRALRGSGGDHARGSNNPKFDTLNRKPTGPEDLFKSDRVGRKGTVSGGRANLMKNSRGRVTGPQGVLPEGELDEGWTVTRGIDKERYQERDGLEGPFSTKSGKVVYYDTKEGKYYDPDTDMYIEYDDWQAMNEGEWDSTGATDAAAAMAQTGDGIEDAETEKAIAMAEDKNKTIGASTPRNFVAKNAKTGGAGAHKDMKRAFKQGDAKHKSRQYELDEASLADMRAEFAKDKSSSFIKSGYVGYVNGKAVTPVCSTPNIAKAHIPSDVPLTWIKILPVQQSTPVREDADTTSIGQLMANDGVTYSPEKEDELIDLMIQYMKKSGMSSKEIRYYVNYDEDYIADQLSYLPKKGVTEDAEVNDSKLSRLMDLYAELDYASREGYDQDDEKIHQQMGKIEDMVALNYGPEMVANLHKHADAEYFGRNDASGEHKSTGTNSLSRMSFSEPRINKSGVMNRQDQGVLKRDIKSRVGKHADPVLPEGTEITEEMIADRLKNELALFKKGSNKSKDKDIGKKPADKEVQKKDKK